MWKRDLMLANKKNKKDCFKNRLELKDAGGRGEIEIALKVHYD